MVQCVSFNICYTNLNGKFMYRTFLASEPAYAYQLCCVCGLMLIFSSVTNRFQMPKCIRYLQVGTYLKLLEKASVSQYNNVPATVE